jgi:hypothetical protein
MSSGVIDALGPDQAAEMIFKSPLLAGEFAAEVLAQLNRIVNDQFRDILSAGPVMYAEFLTAEPGVMERRHAQGSITALGQALRRKGIDPGI